MFFIAYVFKGQVHVFAGRVKIVSHSSCRTSAILKYFCPLHVISTIITKANNRETDQTKTTPSVCFHGESTLKCIQIYSEEKVSQYLCFLIKSTILDISLSNCIHELYYRNFTCICLLCDK